MLLIHIIQYYLTNLIIDKHMFFQVNIEMKQYICYLTMVWDGSFNNLLAYLMLAMHMHPVCDMIQ